MLFTKKKYSNMHISGTTMASRNELEVTITSAKDLKNVNWRHGLLRPYAVVWVDPSIKLSTRADEEGDVCPQWNQTLTVPLPGGPHHDGTLYIDVVHAGSESGTKPLIGSAKLPLRDVSNEVGPGERFRRTLKLKRPSGRPHGKLDVQVVIRDQRYPAPESYYAPPPYGVPPSTQSRNNSYGASPYGGNAPPPPQNPYALPPGGYPSSQPPANAYYGAPPSGYPSNAPPQQPAYGNPSYGYGNYGQQPVYVEERRKSKFGGMGAGLAVGAVAGALGGLAIAEGVDAVEDHIANEEAEKVEDDLLDDGF